MVLSPVLLSLGMKHSCCFEAGALPLVGLFLPSASQAAGDALPGHTQGGGDMGMGGAEGRP